MGGKGVGVEGTAPHAPRTLSGLARSPTLPLALTLTLTLALAPTLTLTLALALTLTLTLALALTRRCSATS